MASRKQRIRSAVRQLGERGQGKRFPERLRQLFDEAAVEAIRYSDQLNRDSEAEYIERLAGRLETNYLDEEALQAFQRLAEPVYAYFVDKGDFTRAEIAEARRAARPGE